MENIRGILIGLTLFVLPSCKLLTSEDQSSGAKDEVIALAGEESAPKPLQISSGSWNFVLSGDTAHRFFDGEQLWQDAENETKYISYSDQGETVEYFRFNIKCFNRNDNGKRSCSALVSATGNGINFRNEVFFADGVDSEQYEASVEWRTKEIQREGHIEYLKEFVVPLPEDKTDRAFKVTCQKYVYENPEKPNKALCVFESSNHFSQGVLL